MSVNSIKGTNSSRVKTNSLNDSVSGFINKISNITDSLTIEDINESVETLEKIGPYLPDPYVEKVNSLVFNFEKVNKVNELVSFLSSKPEDTTSIQTQNILSNKERFNKILLTLKDDMPEEKIKNIRPIIDLVANFDKYKGMLKLMSAMNTQSDNPEDKIDSMMKMVMPMIGQNEESSDKMKTMVNIFKNIASSPGDKNTNDQAENYEKV